MEESTVQDTMGTPTVEYGEIWSKYQVVLGESSSRLEKCADRREFYRNTDNIVPGSISGSGYPNRRHALRVPRAHMAAVELVGKLVGEAPQSHVVSRQESDEERWRADCVEKMLAGIYAESDAAVQFVSAAWHGHTLGAGVFKYWWDFKQNMPKFRSIKPENLLPKFAVGDDQEWEYAIYASERTASSVARKYGLVEGDLVADRIEDGTGREFVTVLDYWDSEMNVIAAGGRILRQKGNIYGFIPYTVVKNFGPNEYVWGFSDQEFFEGLAEYYNTLLSQHADVIKLFSNPPVLGVKTGLTAEALLKIFREGGAIASNKDNADVKVIQAGGAPPEFQAQDTRIRDMLKEASFASPGQGQISGTALMELGVGQDMLIKLKRVSWESAQKKMNEYLLRMVEKLGSGKMSFKGTLESGLRSRSFYLTLDADFNMPSADDIIEEARLDPETDRLSDGQILAMRATYDVNYKRLIDGYYATRIVWGNRTAKEDPQFQLMLLNRFAQGALSLRSFLEEVGTEDVEREVQRIKQENEEMPWLRPQVAQFQQQQMEAMQGGQSAPGQGAFPGGTAGAPGGSPTDAFSQMLNGSAGTSKAQGAVPGMNWGGA